MHLIWKASLVEILFIGLGLAFFGVQAEGLHWAIRWSARFSAFLFLVAFLASSLQRSLHRPWTSALLRQRRYWGLAFAVSQLIHLALIFLAYRQAPETMGPVNGAFLLGGLGYFFTALMALSSNDASVRWLGLKRWRLLHSIGMYLLWAIFFGTYVLGFGQNSLHRVLAVAFALALVFKLKAKLGKRKISWERSCPR